MSEVIITTTQPPTTTPTPKPTFPPLDLVATAVTHNSVSLVWSYINQLDSSNVVYVVEFRIRDINQQWVTAVSSLKENKFTVANLDPDTMYAFNVRAVGQDGITLTQGLKRGRTHKKPVVAISK